MSWVTYRIQFNYELGLRGNKDHKTQRLEQLIFTINTWNAKYFMRVWQDNIHPLCDFKHEKKICALVNLLFFFSVVVTGVCASSLNSSKRSVLGVCAGCGGREEQGFYPFHPPLLRSSVVEVFPATVKLRPCCAVLLAPVRAGCSSILRLLSHICRPFMFLQVPHSDHRVALTHRKPALLQRPFVQIVFMLHWYVE